MGCEDVVCIWEYEKKLSWYPHLYYYYNDNNNNNDNNNVNNNNNNDNSNNNEWLIWVTFVDQSFE